MIISEGTAHPSGINAVGDDVVVIGELFPQMAHLPPCTRTLRFRSFRISAGDLSSR